MNTTNHEFFGSFQRHELDNGLTAVLKPIESATSVSAQVWVEAGSLYENDTNNGLSHFLEHMLFKGTEKFDGPEINAMVERVGGQQNAGTSKDYTTYYVKLPPGHVSMGLELLHQMTFQATFPEKEFQKERDVVLSELARYRDNPKKMLWQQFIPRLYGQHPYHRLTIGQKEVLESTTHDQLIDYYEQFYVPDRIAVVVAGAIDEDETMEQIKDTFGTESESDGQPLQFPPAQPPREANQMMELAEDVEHVYGVLGTIGYPVEDDRSIALDVLMKIFGGGQTSRLHENLVLKQQLASSLSASFWTQRETGPVMIHLQTEEDQVEQLVPAIRKQADRIAREGVSDEELSRAKTQLKTGFIYSSQTPAGQANQIGYWHTIENVEYLEDYIERIEGIDRETVQSVAEEVLVDRNWTGVLLRPDGNREPVKAP